jgi:hypothetical protein
MDYVLILMNEIYIEFEWHIFMLKYEDITRFLFVLSSGDTSF